MNKIFLLAGVFLSACAPAVAQKPYIPPPIIYDVATQFDKFTETTTKTLTVRSDSADTILFRHIVYKSGNDAWFIGIYASSSEPLFITEPESLLIKVNGTISPLTALPDNIQYIDKSVVTPERELFPIFTTIAYYKTNKDTISEIANDSNFSLRFISKPRTDDLKLSKSAPDFIKRFLIEETK